MTTRDDPERIAAAAAVYLRAAAHLAEASLLARLASRHVDDDGRVLDEQEFARLIRAAGGALEKAAGEHEHAADSMSRTAWAAGPQMAEHVDSIRIAVRALNIEAVRLAGWLTDDDDETADVGDEEGLDDQGEPSIRGMLLDRAETFRDKAWLMAESGRVLLDGAHALAERGP